MYKLLNANFFRLKKDVVFWIFLFMSLGIAGINVFRYIEVSRAFSSEGILDDIVKQYMLLIGLFIAIFVSLFIGKEYSNGTVKNKIIVRT